MGLTVIQRVTCDLCGKSVESEHDNCYPGSLPSLHPAGWSNRHVWVNGGKHYPLHGCPECMESFRKESSEYSAAYREFSGPLWAEYEAKRAAWPHESPMNPLVVLERKAKEDIAAGETGEVIE